METLSLRKVRSTSLGLSRLENRPDFQGSSEMESRFCRVPSPGGRRTVIATVVGLLCVYTTAFAQTPEAVFQSNCAQCHSTNNSVGAPLPESLRQMSWPTILTALETGKMKGIGDSLTATQREEVSKYLGTSASQPMPPS